MKASDRVHHKRTKELCLSTQKSLNAVYDFYHHFVVSLGQHSTSTHARITLKICHGLILVKWPAIDAKFVSVAWCLFVAYWCQQVTVLHVGIELTTGRYMLHHGCTIEMTWTGPGVLLVGYICIEINDWLTIFFIYGILCYAMISSEVLL